MLWRAWVGWLLFGVLTVGAAGNGSRSVLVLDQGDSTRPAYQAFMLAFKESVDRDQRVEVRIHEENMRLPEFDSPSYRSDLMTWLRRKYSNQSIDCLVAGGAKAVEVALELRRDLWPGAPVVYAGISAHRAGEVQAEGNITGLWIDLEAGSTLRAALQLFPQTRHVALVGNDSFYPDMEDEAWSDIAPVSQHGRVEVHRIETADLASTRARLDRLPEHSLVLLTIGAYQREGDQWLSLREVVEHLARETPWPIFVQSETVIGRGAVGGVCYQPGKLGVELAGVVSEVLRGPRPTVVPPRASMATGLIFDWQELARWGIDERSLPPDSEVRNRPATLWNQHRERVLVGLGALGLQTVLLAWLFWERRVRRRSEKTALRLGRHLLLAHEEERRRVGRELHDDVSQRIARMAMDAHRLEYAHRWLVPDLTSLRRDIDQLGRDVHALAYRLHPAALLDLGLEEALRDECLQFAERFPGQLNTLFHQVPAQVPAEVALSLYRVVQECLQNVVRHSRANRVAVEVRHEGGLLHLKVEDNGVGFVVRSARQRNGLGIVGMRERLASVGGQLRVRSTPGSGTRIEAVVRLDDGSVAAPELGSGRRVKEGSDRRGRRQPSPMPDHGYEA